MAGVGSTQGWKAKLSLFLPGIFLVGFNIGTGSVTTMASAGANYGMALLWTVLISCAATYLMVATYGRYTLVTGETALEAFRKHIHPAVGLFFIAALGIGVFASLMGVMGIVAEISYEWSKTFISGGIKPLYWAAFFCSVAYFIFWSGHTQVFERILAVVVAIMGVAFVLNFFILMPPVSSMAAGLIPAVPDTGSSEAGPLLLIASMVGTTIFSGLFTIPKPYSHSMADLRFSQHLARHDDLEVPPVRRHHLPAWACRASFRCKTGLGPHHEPSFQCGAFTVDCRMYSVSRKPR